MHVRIRTQTSVTALIRIITDDAHHIPGLYVLLHNSGEHREACLESVTTILDNIFFLL